MNTVENIGYSLALGLLFSFSACANDENLPLPTNDNNQEQTSNNVITEQQEIIEYLDLWCKAMVDRDVATLDSLMPDDMILVHITGATQTKQEWLNEVAAETMRYYDIKRENQVIELSGNQAIARYTSVIDARIWGSRGTWRLNTTMYFGKIDNNWVRINPPQTNKRL